MAWVLSAGSVGAGGAGPSHSALTSGSCPAWRRRGRRPAGATLPHRALCREPRLPTMVERRAEPPSRATGARRGGRVTKAGIRVGARFMIGGGILPAGPVHAIKTVKTEPRRGLSCRLPSAEMHFHTAKTATGV